MQGLTVVAIIGTGVVFSINYDGNLCPISPCSSATDFFKEPPWIQSTKFKDLQAKLIKINK